MAQVPEPLTRLATLPLEPLRQVGGRIAVEPVVEQLEQTLERVEQVRPQQEEVLEEVRPPPVEVAVLRLPPPPVPPLRQLVEHAEQLLVAQHAALLEPPPLPQLPFVAHQPVVVQVQRAPPGAEETLRQQRHARVPPGPREDAPPPVEPGVAAAVWPQLHQEQRAEAQKSGPHLRELHPEVGDHQEPRLLTQERPLKQLRVHQPGRELLPHRHQRRLAEPVGAVQREVVDRNVTLPAAAVLLRAQDLHPHRIAAVLHPVSERPGPGANLALHRGPPLPQAVAEAVEDNGPGTARRLAELPPSLVEDPEEVSDLWVLDARLPPKQDRVAVREGAVPLLQ